MVNNSFKQLLGLAGVLVLMVGCATTSEEDMAAQEAARQQQQQQDQGQVGAVDDQDITPSQPMEEDLVVLEKVFYFDFDSSILKPEARAALTAHAERFKNNSASVRLEGHADERGSREYNMALGERRANAVADFLTLQGVPRSQIEAVSYGEERPASLGSNESAWSMNRRVELQ